MVTFGIDESLLPTAAGTLVYREQDYAFDFEGAPSTTDASVLVNDVQLGFDRDTGQVCVAWGFCPYQGWRASTLSVPTFAKTALVIRAERLPPPGAALRLTEQPWAVYVDAANGWVCIGEPALLGVGAEFAPGCVAILDDRALVALWLHPRDLPSANRGHG
jgi:hypothetical protein